MVKIKLQQFLSCLMCLIILITYSSLAIACPCFNHHNLIQHYKNHDDVTCHLVEIDNNNILSIRIRDKHWIANASSTNCRLSMPYRNITNDYVSYKNSHQNCILEVVRACKELNIPIMGADNVLKAKIHRY